MAKCLSCNLNMLDLEERKEEEGPDARRLRVVSVAGARRDPQGESTAEDPDVRALAILPQRETVLSLHEVARTIEEMAGRVMDEVTCGMRDLNKNYGRFEKRKCPLPVDLREIKTILKKINGVLDEVAGCGDRQVAAAIQAICVRVFEGQKAIEESILSRRQTSGREQVEYEVTVGLLYRIFERAEERVVPPPYFDEELIDWEAK